MEVIMSEKTPTIDGGVIDWTLSLIRTYGWRLTIIIAAAVALIFLLQKVVQTATEKAVENSFAREAKLFELVAGRRSSFLQKVQTDRWEAVNDFLIRIERITTNLNRARSGTDVPGLFKADAHGSNDIVPLTAIFEELEGKRFLLGPDFYRLLQRQAELTLQFGQAKSDEDITQFVEAKSKNLSALQEELDKVFRLTSAYTDKD
jgi:hypothetical protein